jgi:hypothetical protein
MIGPNHKGETPMQPISTPREGLCSVKTAAIFLAISPAKLYQLMKTRQVPYLHIGKSRRIPWEFLNRLATAQCHEDQQA